MADQRESIPAIKRTQAQRGLFSRMLEYQELCLSPAGWDPASAMACLSAYSHDNLLAAEELDTAREAQKYWTPSLKAIDTSSGADGPPVFNITIPPWAAAGAGP